MFQTLLPLGSDIKPRSGEIAAVLLRPSFSHDATVSSKHTRFTCFEQVFSMTAISAVLSCNTAEFVVCTKKSETNVPGDAWHRYLGLVEELTALSRIWLP